MSESKFTDEQLVEIEKLNEFKNREIERIDGMTGDEWAREINKLLATVNKRSREIRNMA